MKAAQVTSIASNLPFAVQPRDHNEGALQKRLKEQDDITAWLAMQESAEIEFITEETLIKERREARRYDDC